jgi:hypothetical protein
MTHAHDLPGASCTIAEGLTMATPDCREFVVIHAGDESETCTNGREIE